MFWYFWHKHRNNQNNAESDIKNISPIYFSEINALQNLGHTITSAYSQQKTAVTHLRQRYATTR